MLIIYIRQNVNNESTWISNGKTMYKKKYDKYYKNYDKVSITKII